MDFVDEAVEAYAEAHTTQPTDLQRRLAEETRATLQAPQMLTGTVEGRFLELLVHGLQARRVLEIGTYSGYGTLSMARGLPDGGRIDSCEIEEKHAAVARRYLEEAGFSDRVQIHVGPATETIERLGGDFDFVFIDADKVNYLNYYEAVLPRLSPTGLIAADNTLWSGRVVEDGGDESTRAIKEFNDRVAADPRVTCVVLTVRDGVTLIRPNR
ncbi:MAG TPA: O-methyltransferase [Gaiellaceae bacterium]|nr:O-methyltransferase [Gaiellaceae bacterium]